MRRPCPIPERKKLVRLWLVWCRWKNGEISLRAVCTSEKRAQFYVDTAEMERNVVVATSEKVLVNHLYLGAFDQEGLELLRKYRAEGD